MPDRVLPRLNILLFLYSIGGGIIIAWHAICGGIMFFALKQLGLFRISAKLEQTGLDETYHNEPAYIFTSRKGNTLIYLV